jgi:hypothetical protein
MADEIINVVIEDSVEQVNINVNDFSISKIISNDAGNIAILGSDGLLYVPTSGGGGFSNHSGLNLDDGTNPHGTTKADVGLSNVQNVDTTITENVAESTDKNYVSDAQKIKIAAIDEAVSSTEKATWNGKQNALGFTPEDSINKTNVITGNETSSILYTSVKAIVDWVKNGLISVLPAKTTSIVDADLLVIGDSADTFKTKTRTFAQFKATLKAYFDTLYTTFTSFKTINGFSIIGSGDLVVGGSDLVFSAYFTNGVSVTDTTASVIMEAIELPTEFLVSGFIEIQIFMRRSGSTGLSNSRIYLGTDATTLGTLSALKQVIGTGSLNKSLSRTFIFSPGVLIHPTATLLGYDNNSVSSRGDASSNYTIFKNLTTDIAVNNFLQIVTVNADISEITTLEGYSIKIYN